MPIFKKLSKLAKSRKNHSRRHANRRDFLRLERLEDRMVLSGASPMAVNDLYSAVVDQPLEISAPGILANDTDPEGDALSAGLFSGPANGTVELNEDGSFVYTPSAGFMGLDSFIYFANDGTSDSQLAAVTIRVGDGGQPPVAVDDAYNVAEDGVLSVALSNGVLANDTDAEGDELTATLVSGPTSGNLVALDDGSFTYIPNANFTGTDSFTYTASDASGDSNIATVTITVDPVNDQPTAENDAYAVDEDNGLTIDAAAGVLGNDADIDGDALTAVIESQPLHGTVTLNPDGSFTYTPEADFNGLDGFSYFVTDGTTDSDVATVTIDVNPINDSPVSVNDEFTTAEDTPLEVVAPGVLTNDTDVDGDALSAILLNPPQHGTVTLNADGSLLYTPDADFNGVDGFSYLAGDGSAESDVASVTINVTPVNDAPLGVADSFATDEDTALTIDAAGGVLANDTDADGDPLTAAIGTGPANGTVTLNADGSFSYTPNENFNGTDTFTYTVGDGTETSAETTVTIEVASVNDAPLGVADSFATDEDTSLTIDAAGGVLANDTDADGDPLTAAIGTGPANGTVTLNADGSFVYTPTENFNGTDTFTYTVSDGTETSAETTVTIEVASVNDAPVGVADSFATDEDTALTIDAAGGVLANDTDADGDPLTAAIGTGPASGTVTLNADGSFVYTPNENFNGTDTFTYTVSDGTETSAETTVTIEVASVNDAPVGVADSYATDEDTALTIDAAAGVLVNDTDADGDPLTAAIGTGPANGTVTLNADGSFSYTPNENFNGTDTFTYTVSDGTATSAETTVTIEVAGVNDAPVAADDSFDTNEDEPITIAAPGVLGNDSDPDGDPLTAAIVTGPANGTATMNADGSFTYTPNENFVGADTFTYKVNDGTSDSSEATVTINICPQNDDPTAANDEYAVDEDVALTIDAAAGVLANDSDVDGDALTAAVVTGPASGTLTLNADGSFNYTPNAGFSGTDSFTYAASDPSGATAEATVTITVNAVNDVPEAVDDAFTVDEDAVLTIDAAGGVLANDTDADGDPLTATVVTGPANGTVTLAADGSFVYTPNANFFGTDTFVYAASDGTLTSEGTVTITVNPIEDAPIAAIDNYSTGEDIPLTVDAGLGVLANDSDPQGLGLTAEVVTPPEHGTLVLNADGSFTYTPEANFNGADSFTYKAKNGTEEIISSANIVIEPLNDRPVAVDDEVTIDAGGAAGGAAAIVAPGSVMDNDSDIDGDDLAASLVTGPEHGTLTLNPDGTFNYVPEAGFTGDDSFRYQLFDGMANSNVATVTLHITSDGGGEENVAPESVADTYSAQTDQALTVDAASGVLANDTDADADALTATVVAGPASGTLALAADGSFVYTPHAGFSGQDTFSYKANDGQVDGPETVVTINVVAQGALPPVAEDDAFAGNAGEALEVVGPGVLENDTDPEGDPLTASVVSGPANGTLTLNADGGFVYTPNDGFTGEDTFTYTATDGTGVSNEALVTITIEDVVENQRPEAVNDSFTVEAGATLDIAAALGLLVNDSDPEGSALTAELFSTTQNGTLALNSDGGFSYTPNAGFTGIDSFLYRASDGELFSALAAVTIRVTASQDPAPSPIPEPEPSPTPEPEPCLAIVEGDDVIDDIIDGDTDTDAIDQILENEGWLA